RLAVGWRVARQIGPVGLRPRPRGSRRQLVRAGLVGGPQVQLEWPRSRRLARLLRQALAPPLGLLQRARQAPRQLDPLLVASPGLLERKRASFQLVHDRLEPLQGLLEARPRVVVGSSRGVLLKRHALPLDPPSR